MHFKGGKAIRDPENKDTFLQKSGVIYKYRRMDCEEEYIGESCRTFGERSREHLKAPLPICDHCRTKGNTITVKMFSIVAVEEQNLAKSIKELFIQ